MEKVVPITNKVMTTGQRLRLLRHLAGLTRKQLGELIQYSTTNIQYWEEDQSLLSQKGCERIIPLLNQLGIQCNERWLKQGLGPWPQFTGALTNKEPEHYQCWTENEEKQIMEEINLFYRLPHSITMNILDNSMEPFFLQGDTIGGINYTEANSFDKWIGMNCIVVTLNKNVFCRQLVAGTRANTYSLHPTKMNINHQPLFDQTLHSIAPISRLWRRCGMDKK